MITRLHRAEIELKKLRSSSPLLLTRIAVALLEKAIAHIPIGYQDATGFHYGVEPEPLFRWRRTGPAY
ncbi:MAG: hypothetical protein ACTHLW_06750 [Verrucomicrobiota bacterium]